MALNKQEAEVRKTEGYLSIIAAMFVLFSAMLDPVISMIGATAILVLFGIYHLVASRGSSPKGSTRSDSPAPRAKAPRAKTSAPRRIAKLPASRSLE